MLKNKRQTSGKNIILGEPVVEKLLENQDEAYEGSHLEMAINQLASLCIKQNVISGVKPSAIAAVGSKNFYRQNKKYRGLQREEHFPGYRSHDP